MKCTDPMTDFLNQLGYAPLRVPTNGSLLGVLLAEFDGKWRRIGTIKDLAECPDSGIDKLLLNPYEGIHPDVSGYLTDKFALNIATPILNQFFKVSVGTVINDADTVSFEFGEVWSKWIDYLPVSTALKACKAKSSDITELFLISGELGAKGINVRFYRSQGLAVRITAEILKALKASVFPDIEIGLQEDTVLTISHRNQPMVFAVSAFMVKVEDDGTIKPEPDILEEPVRAMAMASVERIERKSFLQAVGYQTLLSIE